MARQEENQNSQVFEYRGWMIYVSAGSDGLTYLGAFVALRGEDRISNFFLDSHASLQLAKEAAGNAARAAVDAALDGKAGVLDAPEGSAPIPDAGLEGAT